MKHSSRDLEELLDARARLLNNWPSSNAELDQIYGDACVGAAAMEDKTASDELALVPSVPPVSQPAQETQAHADDALSCEASTAESAESFIPVSLRNYRRLYHQCVGKAFVDVRFLVTEIYLSMFRFLPEDHVIVNPAANAEFIARCRLAGAEVPEHVLNLALLNSRKSGWHVGVKRDAVPSLDKDVKEETAHACEIALRLVSDEHSCAHGTGLTLDRILCYPRWRSRFDTIAKALSPDYDAFVHRLVALSLRKDTRRRPGCLANAIDFPELESIGRLDDVRIERDLEPRASVYLLRHHRGALFAGFCWNIQERIRLHLIHGGVNVVPSSLWQEKLEEVELLVAPLNEATRISAANRKLQQIKTAEDPRLNFVA